MTDPSKPVLTVRIPVTVRSEANERLSVRTRIARPKGQRETTHIALLASGFRSKNLPSPLLVRLTRRYGGRAQALDQGDNLNGSFKHVRDSIANWVGIDDGDEERLKFEYAQAKTGHVPPDVIAEFHLRVPEVTLSRTKLRALLAGAALFVDAFGPDPVRCGAVQENPSNRDLIARAHACGYAESGVSIVSPTPTFFADLAAHLGHDVRA